MHFTYKPYDVFISYVVEDREIVELLVKELESYGFKVWYAKYELYPGAEIRRVIDDGLAQSRYSIALLTPSYTGHWANGELFNMLREPEVFFPVLHEISLDEVARTHPEIVTRFCLYTTKGVEGTAREIVEHIRKKKHSYFGFSRLSFATRKKLLVVGFTFLGIVLLSLFLVLRSHSKGRPDKNWVNEQIDSRLVNFETKVRQEIQRDMAQNNALSGSLDGVLRAEAVHVGNTRYYTNSFDFYDGLEHIRTQVGLKKAGIVNKDDAISVPFGLTEYSIYLFKVDPNSAPGFGYSLICTAPLGHQIKTSRRGEDHYEVDVSYSNCLRYVRVHVSIDTVSDRRTSRHHLFGFKPSETFVFEKQDDSWILSGIR